MPTFGQMIRAYRLGWRWVDQIEAFMRVDGAPGPPYRVDLAPEGRLPNKKIGSGEYKCFWEGDGGIEGFLALSPRLGQIRKVKQPMTLWLDDDGM